MCQHCEDGEGIEIVRAQGYDGFIDWCTKSAVEFANMAELLVEIAEAGMVSPQDQVRSIDKVGSHVSQMGQACMINVIGLSGMANYIQDRTAEQS